MVAAPWKESLFTLYLVVPFYWPRRVITVYTSNKKSCVQKEGYLHWRLNIEKVCPVTSENSGWGFLHVRLVGNHESFHDFEPIALLYVLPTISIT